MRLQQSLVRHRHVMLGVRPLLATLASSADHTQLYAPRSYALVQVSHDGLCWYLRHSVRIICARSKEADNTSKSPLERIANQNVSSFESRDASTCCLECIAANLFRWQSDPALVVPVTRPAKCRLQSPDIPACNRLPPSTCESLFPCSRYLSLKCSAVARSE